MGWVNFPIYELTPLVLDRIAYPFSHPFSGRLGRKAHRHLVQPFRPSTRQRIHGASQTKSNLRHESSRNVCQEIL